MTITRTVTPRGTRSDLSYRYRGVRYRPVLGYNLTSDQEHEALGQVLAAIQAYAGAPSGAQGLTFAAFVPKYLAKLTGKNLIALDRPTTVRMFRIEGGVPRQLDARPSPHAVTQTGTVHTVMAGRLFVTGLVGHVWDGRTIGPPWLISDLPATTDREHTWWVDDALGPRVAELRFCGGGL